MQPIPWRRHVERATHAKRQPQVQIDAPPPGSTYPHIAPGLPVGEPDATSSSSSSSTSDIPSSTSTQVPAPTTSSSISPAQSSGATSSAVAAAATSKSAGLSKAGMAGIVVFILVVVFGIALFLIRMRSRSKRQKKRATWGGAILPQKAEDSSSEKYDNPSVPPVKYPFQTPPFLPPPPLSYNNLGSPAVKLDSEKSTSAGTPATVRSTFIPNLPDEMSISTEETVRILDEYDDGWALCVNSRGEQGVVPLECLEKSAAASRQSGGDWRNAQRASSLFTDVSTRF